MIWLQQHWMRITGIALILVLILVVNGVIKRGLRQLVRHYESRADSRRRSLMAAAMFSALSLPLRVLVWFVGLSFVAEMSEPIWKELFEAELEYGLFRQLVFLFAALWFVVRARATIEHRLDHQRRKGHPLGEQTQIEALGKVVALVAILLTVVGTLSLLGVNVRGLLTLSGLGTIAIGFAGRDVFSNFFAGFMLHLSQPFKIGDYITSPDRPIDGVVEHIGWGMTRIMTLDKKPTYIPNSAFSSVSISNYARMRNRRIKEVVGFRYDDLPRLPEFLKEVREMVAKHPDIAAGQPVFVRFTDYADFSLNVLVQAVTKSPSWDDFLRVKEEILLNIASIADKHNVGFAFPTTTLDLPGKVNISS